MERSPSAAIHVINMMVNSNVSPPKPGVLDLRRPDPAAIEALLPVALMLLVALPLLGACATDREQTRLADGGVAPRLQCAGTSATVSQEINLDLYSDIDLLLVIDSSPSMANERARLAANIPQLLEGLRLKTPEGKLANVHIGVVSADLGAGNLELDGCSAQGSAARLIAGPSSADCVMPIQPWISHIDGQTNIKEETGSADDQVRAALTCMIDRAGDGCVLQQPLEATRRALDPKLNLNPGFVRPDARQLVLLVTDGDDCSAGDAAPLDPSSLDPAEVPAQNLEARLALECFRAGIDCDEGLDSVGVKQGCAPAGDHLVPVDDYRVLLMGLKPPGRFQLGVMTAPTDQVELIQQGDRLALAPSCHGEVGQGTPAPRLGQLVEALGPQGQLISICDANADAALQRFGERATMGLGAYCLAETLLTTDCDLVCANDEPRGQDARGMEPDCAPERLHRVDCSVLEITRDKCLDSPHISEIDRCPLPLFAPQETNCGAACPCWRILPSEGCSATRAAAPLAFEILWGDDAVSLHPFYTHTELHCSTPG